MSYITVRTTSSLRGFKCDLYNGASAKEHAPSDMRFYEKTAVWSAFKRLGLGLGLILLFSAILLLSDLAHRGTPAAANAGAGARKFKAAIVYYAQSVSNDECVNGLLDGLKARGLEE